MENNPEEKWVPVAGYEGIYEVSDMGRVRSMRSHYNTWVGRILTSSPSSNGYLGVALYIDGKRKAHAVHILVATAFCEKPEGCNFVNHKWGIKPDNRATELEWTTCKGNTEHAFRIGLMKPQRGADNGAAILDQTKVDEIRRRYPMGGITMKALGDEFGVNYRTIWAIIHRKIWA